MNSPRALVIAPLAAVLFAGSAAAQPAIPVVYVSNFTGGQVLAVDAATGATTVVLSRTLIGDSSFTPQDLVVGPDGKLYICDSLNSRVWRFAIGQPVVPSSNPVVVATFDEGVYPEGPSFSGSDDLYVNTRGLGTQAVGGTGAQGVWAIPEAAATPDSLLPIAPVSIIPSIGTAGEGTAFAVPGHLLAVDRSGNRVVAARPTRGPFPQYGPSFAPLITSNLSLPVGIAVNTCGDVLVSSGNAIRRFSTVKNTVSGELTAQFQNAYVTFPSGDVVTFFERDAANGLWVNTNSTNQGGKVWRILPATATGGDPVAAFTKGELQTSPLD
jgi:sugar lactone lactonase YvrE